MIYLWSILTKVPLEVEEVKQDNSKKEGRSKLKYKQKNKKLTTYLSLDPCVIVIVHVSVAFEADLAAI